MFGLPGVGGHVFPDSLLYRYHTWSIVYSGSGLTETDEWNKHANNKNAAQL